MTDCQSCNGTGAWPDGRGCGTCDQTGLAEFHPATTWNPTSARYGRISDLYREMGADAPVVFTTQRETFDPFVVAHFVIEGDPQTKGRPRFTRSGHVYTPSATRTSEQVVGLTFRQAAPGWRPIKDATYGLMAVFFCQDGHRRDVDNMLKLILDGLNGVAWVDDMQVSEVTGRVVRHAGEARTEVVIYHTLPPAPLTRKCEHCGSDFVIVSKGSARRFCSQKCNGASRTVKRVFICGHCGGPIDHRNPGEKPLYCSVDCKSAAGRVTRTCTECGTVYTQPSSVANRSKHSACSAQCRAAIARRTRGENAKGTCATCGGPTSKKSYTNCAACAVLAKRDGAPLRHIRVGEAG